MPLDALCLRGVIRELESQIVGTRIEKIQQPARDQVVLTLRGNRKLLLHAGSSQPRIHLTEHSRENPAAPPMFCMLLRKHLSGGYITALEQAGLDRVVILTIRATDELGVSGERRLVLECMGRNANLILLDADGRIIDCLRRVDMEMNQQRQILPGLFYRLPPAPQKENPLSVEPDTFAALLAQANPEKQIDQWLLDTFFGLSPLVCRELAFRGCGSTDERLLFLDASGRQRVADAFFLWQNSVKKNHFIPFLLTRENHPFDISYLPIFQYGAAASGEEFDTFSQLLDTFYETRDRQDRIRQKGRDLLKSATTARDRVARKLAAQEKELEQTQNRETLRICGELITANLYRMERGQRVLQAEDYYQEGSPVVEIALDPLLTPQQNAAKYFKQYTKAKTAEHYLREQLEKGRAELDYLESILDELSRAELEQDFNDIRGELQAGGYLKNRGSRREPKRPPSKPRVFRSSGGLKILVGRSNSQNDMLTKNADKRNIWFHTQKIHGSHVILCTGGSAPDSQSMTEAAILAAYFSQGRGSSQVAVDYTAVKNVKKPSGARPGMVVYTPYQTAYVSPDEAVVHALSADKV